ncbi:sensor histidine kinase [Evansella halocellulosilytica]|uniref:sensor histidine kinase n=1 Tax=Evansella halocellulosilytica TaxID=2011013 RepID=UPI000BB83FED|nr:histidine kinase [Evansella halocellulosilytica]
MRLDLATLDLVVGVVNFMVFILMLMLWRNNPSVKGPALWALSAAISFTGFITMHLLDGSLGIFLNNCGTLIGAIFLMEGILRFRNVGNESRRLKGMVLIIIVSIVMSYINQSYPTARYLYHDIIVVSVCIISMIALLYKTNKAQFFVHIYGAISFLIIIPVFSYRWYLAFSGQIEDKLIGSTQHEFQAFLFLSVIPHIIGWSFGLVLAVSYRLRQQLMATLEAKWLQAQIQPHFIFNTLNSINALSTIDINKMRKLVEEFSEFLRSRFDFHSFNKSVSVKEELSIVKSYLYIEKVRFGEKLNVRWELDDVEEFYLPTLTIQPIVENAIKHGILKQANGGTLEIKVFKKKDYVRVIVKDNGIGMDEKEILSIEDFDSGEFNGVGLVNTNRRLIKDFGTGLNIKSKVGVGTVVAFNITK